MKIYKLCKECKVFKEIDENIDICEKCQEELMDDDVEIDTQRKT